MNRIRKTFEKCRAEKRNALVIYVTMGCPDLDSSERLVRDLIAAGADIIELGVPFSDPMADGAVIQESGRRALASGTTLPGVLEKAARLRKSGETPMILFSYYNVILAYGVEKLAADAAAAGIDGLLAIDLPYEHRDEVLPELDKNGLCLIPFIAPTTPLERAVKIVSDATGFVYSITSKGVTGGGTDFDIELEKRMKKIRAASPVPVVAGFGIDSPEKAKDLAGFSDGIIVGSAVMKRINECDDIEKGIAEAVELTSNIAKVLKSC
ncbi:MAG: tryptophan synthase subunit alpha [Victivallaceae bacterium]|nr:tryptophan synthase subunit alpha [Victivallaceae bacterium]